MFKKVYIEITNICNKNCSFCSKDTKPKKEMTIKEFEHIINEIKPYTNYVYLHVKGEPLIHSKLEQILDICTKNNIWVNITTNGSLLKQKEHILLKQNTIRQINISLHSFKEEEYIDNIVNTVNKLKNKDNINIVYRFWAITNNHFSKDNLAILNQLQKYYQFNIQELLDKNNLKLENRPSRSSSGFISLYTFLTIYIITFLVLCACNLCAMFVRSTTIARFYQ